MQTVTKPWARRCLASRQRKEEDGLLLSFKEPEHLVTGRAELSQPRRQRRNTQRGGRKAGVGGLSFPHCLRHSHGAWAEAGALNFGDSVTASCKKYQAG